MDTPSKAEPSIIDPSVESMLSELSGKEKKAFKKKLYAQNHPEPQATQRSLLKDLYVNTKDAEEKNELLRIACYDIFEQLDNVFLGFLDLYARLHDSTVAKAGTLTGVYTQNFCKWIEKNPDSEEIYEQQFTADIQEKALEVMTSHHVVHMNIVAAVFKLTAENTRDIVLNHVDKLLKRNKFKEALEMTTQFRMKDAYPFDAFLLPRLLQDALPDVREYCRDQPQLQRALINFLDRLIFKDDPTIVAELKRLCSERAITVNSAEKITVKSVQKGVKDLILTYELESREKEFAPNHWWHTREKNIQYMIKRRFMNQDSKYPELDHTSYVSSIKGYMKDTDDGRKQQLLKMLWNSRSAEQMHDAIAWSFIFGLSCWSLPVGMKHYMQNNRELVAEIREKLISGPADVDLSSLTIDGTPIEIIDEWPALQQILSVISTAPLIGIDSEWKPQYLAKIDEVALFQIAVHERVYLIDFVVLENILDDEQWDEFFLALLQSDGIKLGFDFINDLRAMFHNSATKKFKEYELNNRNCVCIKKLMENIIEIDPEFVDLADAAAGAAKLEEEAIELNRLVSFKLSTLCEKFLGVVLDKSQQCSDWANRPLTAKQVTYAAKDAHILLKLFDEIKNIAETKDFSFDGVVQDSMSNCPKRERTKAKRATRRKIDDMTWHEIVEKLNGAVVQSHGAAGRNAQDLRCAVDLMLLGLGKHLRRCGVDVYIPVNLSDLIQKCHRDQSRILFTSGKNADQLRSQFPGRVMILHNANSMEPLQQLRYCFNMLKIRLNRDDIFIRCKECNNLGFLHVPAPVVSALYNSAVICGNFYHDEPFDIKGWRAKLAEVDPSEYDGCGCKVDDNPDWFHVDVHQGRIDIVRNIVIHEKSGSYITTQIKHLPENVIRPGRVFYICGGCGKIYYDGRHQDNYLAKVADLVTSEEAVTTPSASSISEA